MSCRPTDTKPMLANPNKSSTGVIKRVDQKLFEICDILRHFSRETGSPSWLHEYSLAMHGLDPSKFRNVNANKLASSHRVVARFVQKLFEICVFGAHQPRNRFPLAAPRIFTRHARARPHQVQKCECKQIGIIAQGRCNIRSKVIPDLRVGSIRSLCI
jgi:hypothetical protein